MADDDPSQTTIPAGHDATGSPWRTLAAREVYRNPWLRVTEYQVIRPDGQQGIYGVVDPGDNAAIVALDEHEQVTLVGEFFYPLRRFGWKVPSGLVEHGEEPLAAAQRELEEEAGLTAGDWLLLGAYDLSAGISTQVSHMYLARELRTVPARPEGTERIALRRLPLAEALALCRSNELREAISVIAIARAWELLHA